MGDFACCRGIYDAESSHELQLIRQFVDRLKEDFPVIVRPGLFLEIWEVWQVRQVRFALGID